MTREVTNLAAHHLAECKRFNREMPCLFDDINTCAHRPISSHTISKSQLRLIATRGQLLTIVHDFYANDPTQAIRIDEIGYNKASTFPGFCAFHDNELFKTVDGLSIPINAQNIGQFFLRTLGHEFRKKLQQYCVMGSYKIVPIDSTEREKQEFIDLKRHGFQLGARNLYGQFRELAHLPPQAVESAFQYLAIKLTPRLPFAFAAPIVPQATEKYGIWNPRYETDLLRACLLAAIPQKDSTLIALGWHQTAADIARPVLGRLAGKGRELGETIFQLGLEEIENFFVNPAWYRKTFPLGDEVGEFYRANVDGHSTSSDYRPFEGVFAGENPQIASKTTNADWVRLWHQQNL